jgi:hypothetical protein
MTRYAIRALNFIKCFLKGIGLSYVMNRVEYLVQNLREAFLIKE